MVRNREGAGVIRVLFVDHAEALGGAEYSLLLLLKHLDRSRFEPILACNAGPLPEAAQALGVCVEMLAMPRLRGEPAALWRLARGVWHLARYIRRQRIDLVHSNVMRASFYAALAARLTGRPLVWHVRDIFGTGRYVQWMARQSRQAIAISRACAVPLPGALPVALVPNGVDLAPFDRGLAGAAAVRREWDVAETTPLVGMVGSLRPWKGHGDFIRAMATVRDRYPAAHYVVVGGAIFGDDEGYEAELESLTREVGLEGQMRFVGQRDDIAAVIGALDVLVHCSVEPEPFGRVMIEGMAAGRPVVAYDHGGAREIIVPGETGLLVPAGDVASLGHAVAALLADPILARRLGRNGRALAETDYDVLPLTRRIEGVLARAAGRGG